MNRTPLLVRVNPVVAALRPYSPGRPPAALDLFLDANESLAPAPGLADAVAAHDDTPLNRYPGAGGLEAELALRLGIEPAAVLVTAGADDAVERAIRVACAPGRTAVLTHPSFEMLGRYALLAGAVVAELEWWSGEWPVSGALDIAADADVAAVAVVSPNNPTGSVISRRDLDRLATALPRSLILLDHAYTEFADHDLTAAALAHPNVVVFRTFSKAWGAAGLRVGYAAGDPRVLGWMRAVGQPYSVSATSLAAVSRLLDDSHGPPRERVAANANQRAQLARLLAGHGVEVLPSQGNFVLARPADAARLHAALAGLGISVRAFSDPRHTAWLRITVPGETAAFSRLTAALRTALAPEALLLDMDGVLADVSRSYRAAIIATAAELGVSIDESIVAAAKLGDNVTNDWQLTHRLLAERGVDVPLEEVTERFERLYQGTRGRPGLRTRERPLIARTSLCELAARLPLAVVTGRPRRDAERFLCDHGLGEFFAAVITMEDAPAKPDPAPVRLALERLGARHAWMVGDTVDDLRAARAAGVLPIAVPSPGDARTQARSALAAAGAALVLDRIDEILEVLP